MAIDAAEGRRPKGWLNDDVKRVCDAVLTGEIEMEGNKPLTPYRCAELIKKMDSLDTAPSIGAVAAVFKRWEQYGYATFQKKPYAFVDYTDKARAIGLQGIKAERAAERKNARAAEKASAGNG
jgi:hypothetical protein